MVPNKINMQSDTKSEGQSERQCKEQSQGHSKEQYEMAKKGNGDEDYDVCVRLLNSRDCQSKYTTTHLFCDHFINQEHVYMYGGGELPVMTF